MSAYACTCSGLSALPLVLVSTSAVHNLPARSTRMTPSGRRGVSPCGNETSVKVSMRPAGAPKAAVSLLPNSGTCAITESSTEVARVSRSRSL